MVITSGRSDFDVVNSGMQPSGVTHLARDVIVDCDTGTDDAVAIMLAALTDQLRLIGVTTVNGNVPVDIVSENSLRVLDYVGRSDVPVFEGAAHGLRRDDFPIPRDKNTTFQMHGTYLDLPPSSRAREPESAVEFLSSEVRNHADAGIPLTIVATGPLTNIAQCIERDPAFAKRVGLLVVMGGGHSIGNATASAEFNFWADPEAAQLVLAAGIRDVVLVPLDATHQALVSLENCDDLRALGTPAAVATAALIEQRIRAHEQSQPMAEAFTAPVHDALCVAWLLNSSVIELLPLHVDVETTGALTLGRSVIDVHHRSGKPANARVALAAKPSPFVELLLSVFAPQDRD